METTYKQTVYGGLFAADWEVISNLDRLISDVKRGAEGVERARKELATIKECPKKKFLEDTIPIMDAKVKENYQELFIWATRLKPEIELPAPPTGAQTT